MKLWVLLICLLVMSNTVVRGDRVIGDNGSVTAPTYSFEEDQDTGMYSPSGNAIGFTLGGVDEAVLSSSRLDLNAQLRTDPGNNSSPAFISDNASNTGMYFSGTSTIAFSILGGVRHLLNASGYTLLSSADATFNLNNSNNNSTDSFLNMGRIDNSDDGQIQYDVSLRDMILRVQDNDIVRIFSGGMLLENATAPLIRLDSDSDLGTGEIQFGDVLSNNAGRLIYNHEFDDFYFYVGGTNLRLSLEGGGVSVAMGLGGPDPLCAGGLGPDGLRAIVVCSSSKRYKHNILPLVESKYNVDNFTPVQFTWNESNQDDIGFIAEDVHKFYPELVTYADVEGESTIDGVRHRSLVAISFSEIKRLKKENKDILARLEALENK